MVKVRRFVVVDGSAGFRGQRFASQLLFDRRPASWQWDAPQFPLSNIQEITPVAAPDIGTKRICPSCAARFYDLSKKPIVCPKCAFSFTAEAIVKMRRTRSGASVIRDTGEGAVKASSARDDSEDSDAAKPEADEDEEAGAEEVKEVALDDEAIPDPDLVESEDGDEKEDKPEVVGDEVDLEEVEDDDDEDENDDTLIETVDDDEGVADIIDKDSLDKE